MAEWIKELKPDDLPGDLQLVAQECGMEVAITLAEKLGSIAIYIRPIDRLMSKQKAKYIKEHFNGNNHKELAIATGYSERWVYEILTGENRDGQIELFDHGKKVDKKD